jgi:hypothetical protein
VTVQVQVQVHVKVKVKVKVKVCEAAEVLVLMSSAGGRVVFGLTPTP